MNAFSAILELLRVRTGTDFSRYRSSTVTRRVLNRMISVGTDSFEHYLDLLRRDEGETIHLLNRITIKVSRFYRNQATFDALRTEIIPALVSERGAAPLRLWSAGCGCGEEAYTLAMLLEEAGVPGTVEASDIDPRALDCALTGRYTAAVLEELPVDLRIRCLTPAGHGYEVNPAVRARVRFSRHDLTSLAPPPGDGAHFDLICCRNVLIYFAPDVQKPALQAVREALRPGGFLCLGEAEWPIPSIAPSLEPLAHKTKIFRAVDHSLTWTRQ